MHPEGITYHIGINYVLSPPPKISKKHYLDFQKALVDKGIDFDGGGDVPEIHIERKTPPLQIRVIASKEAPVGQLLIIAPKPDRSSEVFGKEADAIVRAFQETWQTPRQIQILSCDSTIRYLYEANGEHAFQELWESRLKQPKGSLNALSRPVLGGGLRFVMPPIPDEPNPTQIEVKIESYLQDTKKIFVEVEFKWPQPKDVGSLFDPMKRLMTIEEYIENQVKPFIEEGRDG